MLNVNPTTQHSGATATGRPLRHVRNPQVRPEQILEAAQQVLLEKGLAATTMDHIASTAGVAKGTMYLYFESKTQILAALRTRWVERAIVACNEAAARGRNVATIVRIQRFLDRLYESTAADGELLRILFKEAGMEDGREVAMVRDEVLKLVRAATRAGELKVRDPEITVSFLLYGVHGVFADTIGGDEAARRRAVAVTRRIVRALLDRPVAG